MQAETIEKYNGETYVNGMLTMDAETLQIPFICKSMETFPLTVDQILTMEKYLVALNEKMISMAPREQIRKHKLFEESQRVTRFLKQYPL